MSFSEAVKSVWNKAYKCCEGRASRSEFWFFALFAFIMLLIPLVNIFAFWALLIPLFSVSIRRLHDTGHTGLLFLIGLIPIIGWIVLIIFYLIDSEPGDNKYGPNPKLIAPKSTE